MKKFISVILTTILVLSSFSVFASAEVVENSNALKFNSDGKFKILHVADIQDTVYIAPQTVELIGKVCDDEKPDLIVLGGDNVAGTVGKGGFGDDGDSETAHKWMNTALTDIMTIFEERNIPTTLVFGNHDGNNYVSKETQMEIYNRFDCFVGNDCNEELYGCATHNLPIMSSDGKKIAYNLWMFDSNEYLPDKSYDYVRDDQVEWYVNTSNELKAANGGEVVPSLAFQHIPIYEIHDAVENGEFICGELNRKPRPPVQKSNQFSAILNQGDIKAMFFGHDHTNTYTINYKGVDLVATPTAGIGASGDENRGIRVIELDENDTSTYKTRLINYLDDYCQDDIEYCRFKMNDKNLDTFPKILYGIRYFYLALADGVSFFKICYEFHCILN